MKKRIFSIFILVSLISIIYATGYRNQVIDPNETFDLPIVNGSEEIIIINGSEFGNLTIKQEKSLEEYYGTRIKQKDNPPLSIKVDEKYQPKQGTAVPKEHIQSVKAQDLNESTEIKYIEKDLSKISTFVNCLNKKNFKIYGVNRCSYTKKLVQTFGGHELISPIYIECTEDKELCSQEGIEGYPTIKVNGEAYKGNRSLEEFAKSTGCADPKARRIEIMLDKASEIASEKLKSKNISIELKEQTHKNISKVVYHAETNKTGKFLGIFKIGMKEETQIDSKTGEVLSSKRPWWAFLVAKKE